jgi:hypothetical protein
MTWKAIAELGFMLRDLKKPEAVIVRAHCGLATDGEADGSGGSVWFR